MTEDDDWGQQNRPHDAESSSTPDNDELAADEFDEEPTEAGPSTSPLRISAVEASVAAGLAPSTHHPLASEEWESADAGEPTVFIELPDWTDPPTGQVPRVLLDDNAENEDGTVTRGPSWRQDSSDWNEDMDLSVLIDDSPLDESAEIAGQAVVPEEGKPHPFSFGDLGLADEAVTGADETDDEAWSALLNEPPGASDDHFGLEDFSAARTRHSHRRGAHRAERKAASRTTETTPAPHKKHAALATATGVVAAGIVALCFVVGPLALVALFTLVVVLAAGEMFAALRKVGFAPATLPGLFTIAVLMVGAYLHGTAAFPFALGIGIIATGLWALSDQAGARPVANLGATFGAICWIGVLGSFAGLLLAPSLHPHRHGVALVIGAIALTVAHDVGSYLVGARLGKHPLAPKVSPNKTIEGLIGGTILTLVIAVAAIAHLHPFSLAMAVELAIVVAVLAPLGDLVESMIKRDLGIKDMGNLLPGHGGMLDRVDAMLFVLPATYYLASVHHLG